MQKTQIFLYILWAFCANIKDRFFIFCGRVFSALTIDKGVNFMQQVSISPSVLYIGVDDKTIDLFESQYVVPNGVS